MIFTAKLHFSELPVLALDFFCWTIASSALGESQTRRRKNSATAADTGEFGLAVSAVLLSLVAYVTTVELSPWSSAACHCRCSR